MEVGVALPVRMTAKIDRDAVDEDCEVGAVMISPGMSRRTSAGRP
jgi:hypothetical protein